MRISAILGLCAAGAAATSVLLNESALLKEEPFTAMNQVHLAEGVGVMALIMGGAAIVTYALGK